MSFSNSLLGSDLLPKGWYWKRAEEACEFITKGTTPRKEEFAAQGKIPYIKVNNLTFTGKLDFESSPTFISVAVHETLLARSITIPGDVLMNIVGPPLGKVSIVPQTYSSWNINQAVARFRPKPEITSEYLALALRSGFTLNWLLKRTKATVGQVNLTLEICRDIPIPIPPKCVQNNIVSDTDSQISIIRAQNTIIRQSLAHIQRLRQAILAKAFSGQLVPQDPSDEPATVLLERIRNHRPNPSPKRSPRRPSLQQLQLNPES